MMTRSRERKVAPAAPDLLVCFPTRAHLRLMPKPICSPSSDSAPHHHRHRHRRKSSSSFTSTSTARIGSPLLWSKSKAAHNSDVSEPTSPKVTCAGQIKVRPKPKPTACKNWQSVMEEIERIHNDRRKHKMKRSAAYSWIESLGFKKDVTQFLSCLRNLRFDFRCFGGFRSAGITSDDDDDDDDDDDEEDDDDEGNEQKNRGSKEESDSNSNAVFSKWYMILQENQGAGEFANPEDENKGKMMMTPCFDDEDEFGGAAQTAPPPNALLLMRSRSAPAKNWPPPEEEKQETAATEVGEDLSKMSDEIAKETWIVGGIREMLARNRSWKR